MPNGKYGKLPDYFLVNFMTAYRITGNVDLRFNIDNVFDETYRQHLDQYNSPGLNARVGLTMRLGAR
jgi:outer membrane receptor protein involved in Fe transport